MKIELKNKLGTINARLKKVEQGRTDSVKDPKSVQATRAGTSDLWQEVQAPPPAETIDGQVVRNFYQKSLSALLDLSLISKALRE